MTRASGRAVRLARLVERLRERPWKVVDLAAAEGVSRRSIERDLLALEFELGEALEVDQQHRYAIRTKPATLNEGEALALYSAARLLTQTGVGEHHYRAAMRKLAQQLPQPARTGLLDRIALLVPALKDRIVDQMAQAWFRQRVARCRYRTLAGDRSDQMEIEVYSVELGHRHYPSCVLGFDRLQRRPVVLELQRMEYVYLLNETFDVPEGFDPERLLEEAFGARGVEDVTVDVRVRASAATQFLELTAATLEMVEIHADGSVSARMRGTRDAMQRALGLIPWLLGWGADLEVVAPDEIREALAREHASAAEVYVEC